MSNPLHASFYADCASQQTVAIVENVGLARDTFRVRFDCPAIARRIVPGQFVMLRLAGCDDPLLGRPLALYDTVLDAAGQPSGLDIVYLRMGKFTSRLANCRPGERLDVWGPLGNGFSANRAEHLLMVAGGIGITPFMALARETLGLARYGEATRRATRAAQTTLCYGARNTDYLLAVDEFRRLGIDVRISTDDGSAGHHGFSTELLQDALAHSRGARRVVCCGPEPMMAAATKIALTAGVECQVSLETPMACGIGICFSCVAKVRDEHGQWDYKRTCVEGPIFDAANLVW